MKRLLIMVAVVAVTLTPGPAQAEAGGVQRTRIKAQRMRELTAIARELQDAILGQKVDVLLKYSTQGQVIRGRVYNEYSGDKNLLEDRGSWLYCYLFDTACHRRLLAEHGGQRNPFNVSVREFFQKNRTLSVKVIFERDEHGAEDLDQAYVVYLVPKRRLRLPMPLNRWGKDFVDCEFYRTDRGWVYFSGVFLSNRD